MLDLDVVRAAFPALHLTRDGRVPIFLDGPAGTQVPTRVIDAISHYMIHCNANNGGVFASSKESDAILDRAHRRVAEFLNAPAPEEIVFGQNMTSLTFHLSRSLAKQWKPGDEVMVTRLDHDANVSPWMLAARDAGAVVRFIDIQPEDCTLDLDSFHRQLSSKTRLVAVGLASNVVGTINPVAEITRAAKAAGAEVFVDAVHFAPHGPIDVQALGCDYLACSAYKFFGPHVGILWGRRALLDALPAYKVRPASNDSPGKWMTGTQNHEGIAGAAAAIDYLADLDPARDLHAAMTAIQSYERTLARRLLEGLAARPRYTVWGIRDLDRLGERVPTIAITDQEATPRQLAERLAARQIYVWHGNNYALEVSQRLGREPHGFVRLGLVHYNTEAEVDRLLDTLDD